jgi:hypothetical protein
MGADAITGRITNKDVKLVSSDEYVKAGETSL